MGRMRLRPFHWTALALVAAGSVWFQNIGKPTIPPADWTMLVTTSAGTVLLAQLSSWLQPWLGETATISIRGVLYMVSVLSFAGLMVVWYLLSLTTFAPLFATPSPTPRPFLAFDLVIAVIEFAAPVLGFWFGLYALTRMVMLDVFGAS